MEQGVMDSGQQSGCQERMLQHMYSQNQDTGMCTAPPPLHLLVADREDHLQL
jgi:hypothetical protein